MPQISRFIFVLPIALSVAGCFGKKTDVSEYVQRAEQYLASGDRDKAQIELRNAIKTNPADPKANFALAQIEDQDGNLEAAVPHYLRAAIPDAHLLKPQLRVTEILIDSNRLQEALGRVNATLGAFPGNADALALRADIEERQGQTASAREDADAVVRKDPANARGVAVMASLALRSGDASQALQQLSTALTRHPSDLRLLQVQAAALLTANQPDKAAEALRSISRSQPQNVAIEIALATLEAQNGHLDDAIAGFRNAIAIDPSNSSMQLAFIKFLLDQNLNKDIVSNLTTLISQFPKTNTYDLTLAGYFRSIGKLEQSRDVLNRALDRLGTGPESGLVQVSLAKVDAETGQVSSAMTRLNNLLSKEPGREDALLLRAQLNIDNGRTTAAIDDLSAVVRANPVNANAFRTLAKAYSLQGNQTLAMDAMKRAASTMVGDDNAQLELAAFMETAKDVEGARGLMARLTLQYPNSPAVWVANAQIAIDRKDWALAARSVSQLRGLPNGMSLASAIDGQLKSAQGDLASSYRDYLTVLQSQPELNPSILAAFVDVAIRSNQAKAAAASLESMIAAQKLEKRPEVWLALMTLYANSDASDKADAAFDKAAELNPKDPGAYSDYADLLTKAKNYGRAKAVLAQGLAAGAPQSALLLVRGWVEETAGELDNAELSYRQALDADPLSLKAANNYANILVDREPKNIAALAEVRERLNGAEGTSDPAIADTIAWLDYRLGHIDEAKALLSRIKAGSSDNPQLRFHMAAVLIASGDKPGGLALIDTLKGLSFPGSDQIAALSAT